MTPLALKEMGPRALALALALAGVSLPPPLARGAAAPPPAPRRYAMRVAYDGTDFAGWQHQPHARTVQHAVEAALRARARAPALRVHAASRTDAGVHARGQCVHFDAALADDAADAADAAGLKRCEHALNRMLPPDVRVRGLARAPPPRPWQAARALPWSAMHSCAGKAYSYRLWARGAGGARPPPLDPLERRYRAAWPAAVDAAALARALAAFEGTHDFRAFANDMARKDASHAAHAAASSAGRGADADADADARFDTTRTVRRAALVDEGGGALRVDVELDGALYKMVRNMVGAALAVAGGALPPDAIAQALAGEGAYAARRREDLRVKSAPAHGLCLEAVLYDDFPS